MLWKALFDWIFSWPGLLVLVPIFYLVLGLGAMSMTPPQYWPQYSIARIAFIIGTVLLLGKVIIEATRSKSSAFDWISITFVSFGILGTILVIALRWIEGNELMNRSGRLIPDNKPTPQSLAYQIPPNGIVAFFGNTAVYIADFPHTIIQMDDKPLLKIDKYNKEIRVSGEFYSRDGKIVAKLLAYNTYWISPSDCSYFYHPNRHQLIVFDRENNQILNIEFINPSVIKVMGNYYLPRRDPSLPNLWPLIINEDLCRIGNFKLYTKNILGGQIDFHFKSDGSVGIVSVPGPAVIMLGPKFSYVTKPDNND
jgi:hypothetical protein